ncbi:MAG: caspase family protein, partial [Bacteroidia bacterium]|nr:caspase family protein [Bacteroidia bacterium]
MSKKLFALLVGINNYPQLNKLRGCIRDVQTIRSLLELQYAQLSPQICTLLEEQATRYNFIQTFRSHFGQAQDGDIVFFHFSGHGSREAAPSAFHSILPDGKNETLVLYDSRDPNGMDLADKELAVLLWEISRQRPQLHIVVSLDCCHSGSGTRNADHMRFEQARYAEREGNPRRLEDYLSLERETESYYRKIYRENNANIIVPPSQHLLLSACSPTQQAWESRDGHGLFSTALTEVLSESIHNPSYFDLFQQVRLRLRQW